MRALFSFTHGMKRRILDVRLQCRPYSCGFTSTEMPGTKSKHRTNFASLVIVRIAASSSSVFHGMCLLRIHLFRASERASERMREGRGGGGGKK